jgi:hypothetical protein
MCGTDLTNALVMYGSHRRKAKRIFEAGTGVRFRNTVLRIMFRCKREEVAGGSRRLHNEELHNLYASSNIIRIIKSGMIRWVGHVARMEGS